MDVGEVGTNGWEDGGWRKSTGVGGGKSHGGRVGYVGESGGRGIRSLELRGFFYLEKMC